MLTSPNRKPKQWEREEAAIGTLYQGIDT